MTSEALGRARLFHSAIRRALIEEWDPIGVGVSPEAQDEYDGYVPAIYKLLIARQPQSEVFAYLWWAETEHMGLTGNRQVTEAFAQRLSLISEEIDSILQQPPTHIH